MTKVPSVSYPELIRALQRDGWVVVRQRGSHIRLHKHTPSETLKVTVPAHRPVQLEQGFRLGPRPADGVPGTAVARRAIGRAAYRLRFSERGGTQ